MNDVKPRSCIDCSNARIPKASVFFIPKGQIPKMDLRLDGKDRAIRRDDGVVGPVRCRKDHWLAYQQKSLRNDSTTKLRTFVSVKTFMIADTTEVASDCPDYDEGG